ncbi:MAG: 6-bladed beta-propeller [Bacteroidales bacterium]
MKGLYSIFIIFALCACNSIKESTPDVYVFDKTNAANNDLSTLFSKVSYTPLETTEENLIGFNPQLFVSPQKIYVFDQQYSKRVLTFDTKGNFQSFIGQTGNGPGEYAMAKNFIVDESADEIIINATPSGTLYHYNLDGTFRNSESLEIPVSSFTLADNDMYWIYTGGSTMAGPDKLYLYKGTQKVKGYLPVTSDRSPAHSECFSNSPVRAFQESFNENIYHLVDDSLQLAHKLNFGSLQVPQNIVAGMGDAFHNYLKQNSYITVFRYLENRNFVYIGLVENNGHELAGLYHWVIDKRSGKDQVVQMDPQSEFFMGLQYPLQLTANDELLFLMDASFFPQINQKSNPVFYKENSIDKVSENPVLTSCKLKPLK